MNSSSLRLRMLCVEDEMSFRAAVNECKPEAHIWDFAFGFDEQIVFQEYVDQLFGHPRGISLPTGWVPNTYFVGVVNDVIVGRLSLRHTLNDFLEKIGGHIGYGVLPSQRKKGYATEMLRQAIPICASLKMAKALVTCDQSNIASRKVIEACGGIFECSVICDETGVPHRRYWINTDL